MDIESGERIHHWKATPTEARDIQQRLRSRVIFDDDLNTVRCVAGIDVGFESNQTIACAAAALLSFPGLEFIQHAFARRIVNFPYMPGLLSFREVPVILEALERLGQRPDLLVCDGQGYAHPRRFGLACHLGVLTNVPSIGAAKTRLIGTHGSLPWRRGAWIPLVDAGETVGAVLRTRSGVKPIFVSVGHRISLETAVDYALKCCTRYRLPETTRWAHRLASAAV